MLCVSLKPNRIPKKRTTRTSIPRSSVLDRGAHDPLEEEEFLQTFNLARTLVTGPSCRVPFLALKRLGTTAFPFVKPPRTDKVPEFSMSRSRLSRDDAGKMVLAENTFLGAWRLRIGKPKTRGGVIARRLVGTIDPPLAFVKTSV